jgi:hypothetical protein
VTFSSELVLEELGEEDVGSAAGEAPPGEAVGGLLEGGGLGGVAEELVVLAGLDRGVEDGVELGEVAAAVEALAAWAEPELAALVGEDLGVEHVVEEGGSIGSAVRSVKAVAPSSHAHQSATGIPPSRWIVSAMSWCASRCAARVAIGTGSTKPSAEQPDDRRGAQQAVRFDREERAVGQASLATAGAAHALEEAATVLGASSWSTWSRSPMSMPSSRALVATITQSWPGLERRLGGQALVERQARVGDVGVDAQAAQRLAERLDLPAAVDEDQALLARVQLGDHARRCPGSPPSRA